MAVMPQYVKIDVKCHMDLCGYEGSLSIPDTTYYPLNKAMGVCPKCGYFTLHQWDKLAEYITSELRTRIHRGAKCRVDV